MLSENPKVQVEGLCHETRQGSLQLDLSIAH